MPDRRTVALLLACWLLALPGVVWAQDQQFSGRIQQISERKLTVACVEGACRGDNFSFMRSEKTRVVGRKSSWQALARGDLVSVSWQQREVPRQAYVIRVRAAGS